VVISNRLSDKYNSHISIVVIINFFLIERYNYYLRNIHSFLQFVFCFSSSIIYICAFNNKMEGYIHYGNMQVGQAGGSSCKFVYLSFGFVFNFSVVVKVLVIVLAPPLVQALRRTLFVTSKS